MDIQTNRQKVAYIESLGFEVQDYDDQGLPGDTIFFSGDYDYEIEFDGFEIGDTSESICNSANIYSCCGDILDKDWMICPTCKEHC
jgi:hypothetical protein